MRINKNKTKVAVVAAALVIAGGAAFAYWTAGGGGTGTADTGTSAALVVNQTSVVTDMAPGVAGQNLSGTFTNSNPGPSYVASVTATLGAVTGADGICANTNYLITNPVSTVNAEVVTGSTWGLTDTPTVAFVNDPLVNQDGCKNAQVAIVYTIQSA